VLWKLRAIVYGGIAVAAALVLVGLGGDEESPFLEGRTAQGNRFTMELEEGRPASLGTYLDATCERDHEWRAKWWSIDGKTSRFRFDDGKLDVRETVGREYDDGWTGERRHTLTARLEDDRIHGTMTFVETMRRGADAYDCASGDVSFSARAG
jgi:hypothetical protein